MTQVVTVSIGSLRNGQAQTALTPNQMAPLADTLAALMLGRQVGAFAAEGHHLRGGKMWAPLSEPYGSRKRDAGFTRILTRTGRLRNTTRSLGQVDEGGLTIALFADAPYAQHHQHGTSRMPARPVFEITEADINFTSDVAERFIGTLLRKEA